jgi:hypothetical protein
MILMPSPPLSQSGRACELRLAPSTSSSGVDVTAPRVHIFLHKKIPQFAQWLRPGKVQSACLSVGLKGVEIDRLTNLRKLTASTTYLLTLRYVFSDEIYGELVYDGVGADAVAPSFLVSADAHGLRERTVMFDGASKTYCMTGWRLGWAVMPRTMAERVHLLMVHAIGCTANFTQIAGAAALDGPRDGLDAMLAEYVVHPLHVADHNTCILLAARTRTTHTHTHTHTHTSTGTVDAATMLLAVSTAFQE